MNPRTKFMLLDMAIVGVFVCIASAAWISYREHTGAFASCVYANASFYQRNGIAVTMGDLDTIRGRCAWAG